MGEDKRGERLGNHRSWFGTVPQTIIAAVVFFLLLLVLSAWSNSTGLAGLRIDPTLVLIALVPFVIFLVISGQVQSLTLPGGLGLVFRTFAKQPIAAEKKDLGSMPLDMELAVATGKGGVDELGKKILQENPNTLSFNLQKKGYYAKDAISKYLEYPNFRYILFNDASGKSRALMKAEDFKALHHTPGVDTVNEIESGRVSRDAKVVPTIREGATNKEALNLMDSTRSDTLSVVDAEGKHVGVVTRDAILKNLMAKLLTS